MQPEKETNEPEAAETPLSENLAEIEREPTPEVDPSENEEVANEPLSSDPDSPQPPASEPLNPEPRTTPVPLPIVDPDKHSRKRLAIILSVVFVVLIAAAVAGWYFFIRTAPLTQQDSSQNITKSPTPSKSTEITDPSLAKLITPKTGEAWDKEPKELAKQGYWTDEVDPNGPVTTYYQVGKRGDNTILMTSVCAIGCNVTLFEKAPDGKITLIAHPDGDAVYTADDDEYKKSSTKKSIVFDTQTHYDSLTPPKEFTLKNKETLSTVIGDYDQAKYLGTPTSALTNQQGDSNVKQKDVVTYGGSKIIRIEHPYVDTKLTSINYSLSTPISTQYDLNYQPIAKDLSGYTWNNGVAVAKTTDSNSSTIGGIVRGCGSAASAVSRYDGAKDGDFVPTGKTADGKTVYEFKDSNNQIVQKSYSEYKDFYKEDPNAKIISFAEFLKQHAIIAYKNADGEWLIYTRDQYAAVGGCAKPVVYLYPTKTQQVSVRVGADVKISDPLYDPSTGWLATAQPNGQLSVNGKKYDSLFWEGPGIGQYPGIVSGTIVKRADAVSMIRTQLAQQGLNTKESNDFIEYWQDRIPNKPYIRLTWFNTAQLNELAPLWISPRPDTMLRVFLDMSGYDTKISIPKQKLSSTPRQGFTVVEWGGLAHQKLY